MQRHLDPLCLFNEAQCGSFPSQVEVSEESVLLADELRELDGLEAF